MNKKIAILSVYNYNYGSILQAYALQQVLEKMGNKTEILVYKKTNYFKQALRLLYFPLLKSTLIAKWKNIYCKIFYPEIYQNILISRELAFRQFVKNNLKFSKVYKGRKKLIAACGNYDCFVLGSDQVWNPMNFGGDYYTMSFIPDNKKKITYAPSFGVSGIPKSQKKKTRKYLQRIDHISVREEDGKRIIKELTGRDVDIVLDPTLLVERELWDRRIKGRLIKENYIFCYFISANRDYRKFAIRLKQLTKLKIVSIPHVDEFVKSDIGYADFEPSGIGPEEFINLIANASYVCTDSFHGSAFSTLYEKVFFTFNRYKNNSKESTNSRIHSFLKMVGLENRIYKSNSIIKSCDLRILNYNSVKEKLKRQKQKSIEYLTYVMKG